MKVVCTVEARMRSSRLPGKVLKPAVGKPMLELMIERLKRARTVDAIVVATTDNPSDQPIEDLARELGVGCFRGSEADVLDRVLKAARQAAADVVVETTGDCPLISPEVVDKVVETFLMNKVDYCSNLVERTFPRGMDVEVFWFRRLEEIAQLATDPTDREHVSTYFHKHRERYSLLNVASTLPPGAADIRLTVDTQDDLEMVSSIFESLYLRNPEFDLEDVLNLVADNPSLTAINSHVEHKAVFSQASL